MQILLLVAAGYLVGSIPTGVMVGRWGYGVDIRRQGSGGSGGTNAARVLGWVPGLLVVILDLAKGYIGARSGAWLAGFGDGLDLYDAIALAGFFTVVGHIVPVFASFRGGKGVAPAAGVLLAVQPQAAGIALVCFAILLAATRIVSVASIGASVLLLVIVATLRWGVGLDLPPTLDWLCLALTSVIVLAHRANLGRLVAGTEPELRRKPRDLSG
jgi:glycerol-3-phosphate acyltransferase PlsY